jgi:hypothetical protein
VVVEDELDHVAGDGAAQVKRSRCRHRGHRNERIGPAILGWPDERAGRTVVDLPALRPSLRQPRQSHTCAPLTRLDDHFVASAPEVRATFEAFLAAVRELGPVTVLPERSRIALQVRMSFAALMPRRRWLNGHLVLAREVRSDRFLSRQALSPHNVVHTFRLHGPDEVDAELTGWLAEAYRVGEQRHLYGPPLA